MSITYVEQTDNGGDVNPLTAATNITVAVGDILLGFFTCHGAGTFTCDDGASGNTFTMLSPQTSNSAVGQAGYCIVTTAETYKPVFNTGGNALGVGLIIFQYRPSATASFDTGPHAGTGTSTTPLSLSISPAADVVVFGGACDWGTRTYSSPLIGGAAADQSYLDVYFAGWSKVYASAPGSIAAQVTLDSSADWICDVFSIKNSGGAAASVQAPALQRPRTLTGRGPL
jgi:hypothetical protein